MLRFHLVCDRGLASCDTYLPNQYALKDENPELTMLDMDKVMSAMNAGDASKISPVIMRAQKKAAMAEARKLAAARIEEAKKVKTAKVTPIKTEANKAASTTTKKASKAPVKKAAATKKVAHKTMKQKAKRG
jgi:hypothetical protein